MIRLAALAVALATALPSSSYAETLSGRPRIVDDDTVVMEGKSIRFDGIDAPETDQVCHDRDGKRAACRIAARDRLIARFGSSAWSCGMTGRDVPRGRFVGRCAVGGEDVNRWLVREGLALDSPLFSRGRYAADEAEARKACRGIWAGVFVRPWEWRKPGAEKDAIGCRKPGPGELADLGQSVQTPPDQACTIKANFRRADQCIYHLPGSGHWRRLQMSGFDRRWFCTAEEAEAAGCRAARR